MDIIGLEKQNYREKCTTMGIIGSATQNYSEECTTMGIIGAVAMRNFFCTLDDNV